MHNGGFRPPLCTYRLNWARRTSWGWWDEWDDTVLQTQDSKFEPWRSEAEHATSRSRRLPTILTFTRGWGRKYRFILTKAWLISHLTLLWPLWPWLFSDRQIFPSTRFTQHFFMNRFKIYTISISLIARMSLKLGKIRTETRSWRPKWPIIGYLFCTMRKIWKTGPDS